MPRCSRNHGENPMGNSERIAHKALGEQVLQICVEPADLFGWQARGYAGARANASAPRFMTIGDLEVKGEGLDILKSGNPGIAQPGRIDPFSSSQLPGRVMSFN